MSDRPTIIFRADGNAQTGLGHVIRCCALADMVSHDYYCVFYIREPSEALQAEILRACDDLKCLPAGIDYNIEITEWSKDLKGNEIIVLDGYHFGTEYQQVLKQKGHIVICIDDIHAYHFVADAIINHSGGLSFTDYDTAPLTELCLGPSFALLRQPFLNAAKAANEDYNKNAFICLGGADPKNDLIKVLNYLQDISFELPCHVILGSAYSYEKELGQFLESTILNICIFRNVSADEMARLMASSQIGVCAPSSVAFEYLSAGGDLFLYQTADNQADVMRYFLDAGLAFRLENYKKVGTEELHAARTTKKLIFDGNSAGRLQNLFERLSLQSKLNVRRATIDDTLLYYNWANDPDVRSAALNQDIIPYEDHLKWFKNRVNSSLAFLYVVSISGTPIGQVRFDTDPEAGTALISYSIDQQFRGKGFGIPLFRAAALRFIKECNRSITFMATVKQDNYASANVFRKLGFSLDKTEETHDATCYFFSLTTRSHKTIKIS